MNKKNILKMGVSAFLIGTGMVLGGVLFVGRHNFSTPQVIAMAGLAFLAGVGTLIAIYKSTTMAAFLAATFVVWNIESLFYSHPLLEMPYGRMVVLALTGLAIVTFICTILYRRLNDGPSAEQKIVSGIRAMFAWWIFWAIILVGDFIWFDRSIWPFVGLGLSLLGVFSTIKKVEWLSAGITGLLLLGVIGNWLPRLGWPYSYSLLPIFLAVIAPMITGTVALFQYHRRRKTKDETPCPGGIVAKIKAGIPRDTPAIKRYALGIYICAVIVLALIVLALVDTLQEPGSCLPATIAGFILWVIILALVVVWKSRMASLFMLFLWIMSIFDQDGQATAFDMAMMGAGVVAGMGAVALTFVYHRYRLRGLGKQAVPIWRTFSFAAFLMMLFLVGTQSLEKARVCPVSISPGSKKSVNVEIINPLYAEAPNANDNIVITDASTVDDILKKTTYHYARHEYDEAIALGEAALKKTQDKQLLAKINFSLSSNYLEKGIPAYQKNRDTTFYKKSIECATKALEGFPNNWQVIGNIGVAYSNMGDFKNASFYFHRAMEVMDESNPNYGFIVMQAALADEMMKNPGALAKKKQTPEKNSPLTLQGIIDGNPPMALINNATLKEGDIIQDYIIKKITTDQVLLAGPDGEDVVLSFE